jgi:Tol biopolymer transport system component
MMSNRSRDDFDRLMTSWFEDDAHVPEPDDLVDRVVLRTRRSRRRPRWLLPEWWLPMQTIARWQAVWRPAPLLLLLAALVLLGTIVAILAGGNHPRLPAPFGPAANGRLVFDTNATLAAVNPSGAGTLPLVDRVPHAAGVTFSRDGTRLVFWGDGSPDTLYVASADGTGVKKLASGLWIATDKSPTGSPDGRHVASSTESGPGQLDEFILVIDVESGVATKIVAPELNGFRALLPAWSPDGAWIAFVGVPKASPDQPSYWIVHPDATAAHELATSKLPDDGVIAAHWAPDVARSGLAYMALAAGGSLAAYVYDVPTGHETRISGDGGGFWPAWSPDGRSLAFLTDSTAGDVRIVSAEGSAETRTIPRTGIGAPLAWSPDGREIYGSNGARTALIVITVDGSTPLVRIPHAASQALPDWQRVAP